MCTTLNIWPNNISSGFLVVQRHLYPLDDNRGANQIILFSNDYPYSLCNRIVKHWCKHIKGWAIPKILSVKT